MRHPDARRPVALAAAAASFFLAITGPAPAGDGETGPAWVFVDNGTIRLGVKTASGAAIGHLSASGPAARNLLNHYDHGRLVQQSYYGDPDGSRWADKPWRWNPVQGGDYKGGASTVLALRAEATSLYAKTRPRNWAGCTDLPEVTMEEWVTLDGPVAHVRYRMTYEGTARHARAHQEVPALFTEPDLDTLVLYDGDHPWTGGPLSRSRPGWPNESRRPAEHWAAYVGPDDFGVGAFVPVADALTCYRFGAPGGKDACSYFAPLTEFAVTPGFTFEYDLYLAVGKVDAIRRAFRTIHEQQPRRDGGKPATP